MSRFSSTIWGIAKLLDLVFSVSFYKRIKLIFKVHFFFFCSLLFLPTCNCWSSQIYNTCMYKVVQRILLKKNYANSVHRTQKSPRRVRKKSALYINMFLKKKKKWKVSIAKNFSREVSFGRYTAYMQDLQEHCCSIR